jgi:hypothetical protein
MHLDFWNNPLVVSAMRVDYRQNRPALSHSIWLGLLCAACIGATYGLPHLFGRPLTRDELFTILFLGLVVAQTVIASIASLGATAKAMLLEVTGGTLDFLRITPLDTSQILLGKMLGPPGQAYLNVLASFPLAFVLYLLDVPGLTFMSLVLIYVNMVTTLVLTGALGLQSMLQPLRQQGQAAPSSGFIAVLILIGQVAAAGQAFVPGVLDTSWSAALASLAVPMAPLVGLLKHQDPWHYPLSLFGWGVPFLLATPCAQLGLAVMLFRKMQRRLANPVNLVGGRADAYVTLIVADIVAAAVLFDATGKDRSLRLVLFWLWHLAVSTLLVVEITPWRELLETWAWRFRGRGPAWRDRWLGDRSENGTFLVTICVIGLAIYFVLVILPESVVVGSKRFDDGVVFRAPLLVCLLTLSVGTVLQWSLFAVGRNGWVFLPAFLACDPITFGYGTFYNIPWLMDLTVTAHCQRAFFDLPIEPLVVLHIAIYLLFRRVLHNGLQRMIRGVNQKLQTMGVMPPA